MFLRSSIVRMASLRVGDVLRNGQGRPSFLAIASQKRFNSTTAEKEVATVGVSDLSSPKGNIGRLTHHRVNKIEKFCLVWAGNYKSMAEVPAHVSQDSVERARNKARIKVNLLMALATLAACVAMVISGKKARREGKSWVKMNEEWHKRMNEELSRKEAKQATM